MQGISTSNIIIDVFVASLLWHEKHIRMSVFVWLRLQKDVHLTKGEGQTKHERLPASETWVQWAVVVGVIQSLVATCTRMSDMMWSTMGRCFHWRHARLMFPQLSAVFMPVATIVALEIGTPA